MLRTARLWERAGPLTLSGLLLSGSFALATEVNPSPVQQLITLGGQAKAEGQAADAAQFYRKALQLDPKNAEARKALASLGPIRRVSRLRQDPAPAGDEAGVPAAPPQATIERSEQLDKVLEQQLVADIRDQIARARDQVRAGQPEAALDTLRLAQNAMRSADQVREDVRSRLQRQLDVEYRTTLRREEELTLRRAEDLRLQAAADQRLRTLAEFNTNQENVTALMAQFDTLMSLGQYNVLFQGGTGDLVRMVAPFYDAQTNAKHARALDPSALAPRAGLFVVQTISFLAQTLGYEELKEYRFMMTLEDVDRASVPFPDTITIEYPDAEVFKTISEKRIRRYESSDLGARDTRSTAIYEKLNQPITLPFEAETSLEDVKKYIQNATQSPDMPNGIPIYIDPEGLNDADKTMASTVSQLGLDGVPLKKALQLILKQLDLTYTVKDGLLTISSKDSGNNEDTVIRVYPVADLSIIPLSLMGGGGGGMGGGGMGGGGMGGGGMGGGMGGGGMGGGGMGGGMRSVRPLSPAEEAQIPASGYLQKKSN